MSRDSVTSNIKFSRILIYIVLIIFAVYYLLPLYVMLVNSLKPLEEIRGGGMLYLPSVWTLDPWRAAWSSAQIGVDPSGFKTLFLEFNSHGCASRFLIDSAWLFKWLCSYKMAV